MSPSFPSSGSAARPDASARAARDVGRRNGARRGDDPLAACARALADVAGARVDEPVPVDGTAGTEVSAPARGLADASALHRAHHDAALHRARAPRDAVPRALFGALERERVEALGANGWAGVRTNLDALRALDAAPSGPASGADPLARATGTVIGLVREALAAPGASSPEASAALRARSGGEGGAVVGDVERRVAAAVAEHLAPLADSLDDQAAFARHALALIRRLGLEHAPGDEDGRDGEAGESADDAVAEPPADAEAREAADADEEEGGDVDGERTDDDVDERSLDGESDAEEDVEAATGEPRDEPPVAGVDPRATAVAADAGYRVFTRAFDEVVDARALADPAALAERRAELDRHLERQGRLVRRLATRLQKVLLARQRREWQHDLDEGHLDTRRLHRLVTAPLAPIVFKGEVESAFRDTTVTLLIDNSRSMIGRPIMIAAACADILARTLERCGVAVEVLGFTTVELHGGRSTAAWEAAGRPPSPGRLNDVRHIVYKSADVSYRSARRSLALMLERDVLKQNIDGEALQWAASRLMRRPSERRILLVISDGAPVDTATLAANPRDYLDRHLDAVVADLERRGAIELTAIGIGHDVGRFYSQAMSVFDARGLAPALLSRLESLFRRAA